jgi:transposase-like protein
MKQEQTTVTAPQPRKRRVRSYSAKEKAEAVLALWSGRRNASTLMKEMEVPWGLLNSWEKRALTGMLTALDPTWKQPEETQPSLPARVEKLIEETLNPAAPSKTSAA